MSKSQSHDVILFVSMHHISGGNTRIITIFRFGDPNLNLHFPLLVEGGEHPPYPKNTW